MGAYDFDERIAAVIYLNGEINYEINHICAINQILRENGYPTLTYQNRPRLDFDHSTPENFNHDQKIINDYIQSIAYAHLIDNDGDGEADRIQLETDSIYGIDINTVANTLKNYFNLPVYDDNTMISKRLAKKY